MRPKRRRRSIPPAHTFPTDLWPDVLARLPVKTLLQFRSVCMFFCFIIGDPEFTPKQFKLCKDNRRSTHILSHDKSTMEGPKDCVLRRIDTFYKTRNFEFEPYISKHYYKIVQGFVNGLVLMQMTPLQHTWESMCDDTDDVLVLWNPSIRRHVNFVTPKLQGFYRICFGYDPMSNDYKLLIICFPYDFVNEPVILYIARLNNNPNHEWTTKTTVPGFNLYPSGKCVYLDGHVYMTGSDSWGMNLHRQEQPQFNTRLIAFDLANESITSDTELPITKIVVTTNVERCLFKFGEFSLALYDAGCYQNSIWVMEKFDGVITWSHKYKFNLYSEMFYYMCIGENGLVLYESVKTKCPSGVISYDLETGDKKIVAKARYFPGNLRSACVYEESLVLFGLPPLPALVAPPEIEVEAEAEAED